MCGWGHVWLSTTPPPPLYGWEVGRKGPEMTSVAVLLSIIVFFFYQENDGTIVLAPYLQFEHNSHRGCAFP